VGGSSYFFIKLLLFSRLTFLVFTKKKGNGMGNGGRMKKRKGKKVGRKKVNSI
jgi:hypothetical protein